jgi:hypothetical protein
MAEKNSLWKNIRNKAKQNKRTGATPKKPSAEMLRQERKIKSKKADGGYMYPDGGTYANKQGVIMGPVQNKDGTYTLPVSTEGNPQVNLKEFEVSLEANPYGPVTFDEYLSSSFNPLNLLFDVPEYQQQFRPDGTLIPASGRVDIDNTLPLAFMGAKPSYANFERGVTKLDLNNTHKLNPWAFKTDPNKFYRQIDNTTYKEGLQSGLIKGKQAVDKTQGDGIINLNKSFADDAYYNKGSLYYKDNKNLPYLYEAALPEEKFIPKVNGRTKKYTTENTSVRVSKEPISINDPFIKTYKKDWLQGYKPVKGYKADGGHINPYMYYSGGPMEYKTGGALEDVGKLLVNTVASPLEQISGNNFVNWNYDNKWAADAAAVSEGVVGAATDVTGSILLPGVYGKAKGAVQGVTSNIGNSTEYQRGANQWANTTGQIGSSVGDLTAGIVGGDAKQIVSGSGKLLNTIGKETGSRELSMLGQATGVGSMFINPSQATSSTDNSTILPDAGIPTESIVNQGMSFASHGGNITNNSLNLQSMKGRYQNYKQRMSKGGTFNQHGINFIPESAGLHHQSAYGGVPIGPGALAEGGEIKMDTPDGGQYIVSDQVDGTESQMDFTFTKSGKYKELDRTLAEGMKQDLNRYSVGSLATNSNSKDKLRRPNDSYSKSTIDQIKQKWQQKTEFARQRSQQEQAIAQAQQEKQLIEEEFIAAYGGKINPKKYPGLNMPKRSKGGYVYNAMTQPMLAHGGPLVSNVKQPFNGPAAQNRGGMMMANGGIIQSSSDKLTSQEMAKMAKTLSMSPDDYHMGQYNKLSDVEKAGVKAAYKSYTGSNFDDLSFKNQFNEPYKNAKDSASYLRGYNTGYETGAEFPKYSESTLKQGMTNDPLYRGNSDGYFNNPKAKKAQGGMMYAQGGDPNQTQYFQVDEFGNLISADQMYNAPSTITNMNQPSNTSRLRRFTNLSDEGVDSAALSNIPIGNIEPINFQQQSPVNIPDLELTGNIQPLGNNDFIGKNADGNDVSINPDMYYKYQTGQFTPEGATLSPDKGFFSKAADMLKGKSGADALIAAGQLAGPLSQFLQKKPEPFQYKKASATTVDPTTAIILSNEEQRRAQDTAGYNIKQNAPTSGSYLSNMRALGLGAGKQRGASAAGIRQQYDVNNAGILNQFEQYNTELENRAIDAMQQDEANFQEQRTNALYNAGANIAGMRKDYKINEVNKTIANNIGTNNFRLSSDGKSVILRDVDGSFKVVPLSQVDGTTTPATKQTPPSINTPVAPYSGPMANYLSKNKLPDFNDPNVSDTKDDKYNLSSYGIGSGDYNYTTTNEYVQPPDKTDTEAIKTFQDWMDEFKPNWLDNNKSLGKGKGYGNLGGQTKRAWNDYGKEFLGKVPNTYKAVPEWTPLDDLNYGI